MKLYALWFFQNNAMFVLMHGEVSAEGEPGIMHCKTYKSDSVGYAPQAYCKTKEITCVRLVAGRGMGFSCVKN
jgi:hypothetical protein